MASIYDLDDVGFVGGQFEEPEEDAAFFTAYFKKLKAKRTEQEKKKSAVTNRCLHVPVQDNLM
jgi:hypothetical protein